MDKKKFQRELQRLKQKSKLSEDELILFALSLSASPDERWERHENFLRSHGLLKHSSRAAFGFK